MYPPGEETLMEVLAFRVVSGWLAGMARSTESELRRTHRVTLERNGKQLDVRVGGKSRANFKVRLADTVDPARLQEYVTRYRTDPGGTRPEAEVREALHSFLFAGGLLDGPFVQQVDCVAAVHLRMRSTSRLTTALPWELADGPPTAGSVPTLLAVC
jgi:hypothetical protein